MTVNTIRFTLGSILNGRRLADMTRDEIEAFAREWIENGKCKEFIVTDENGNYLFGFNKDGIIR